MLPALAAKLLRVPREIRLERVWFVALSALVSKTA
jgi:hypothetical protein